MRSARVKGQFKKEWTMMKGNIFIYAMVNFIFIVGGPFMLRKILGATTNFLEDTLLIGGFWFIMGMFIGIVVLCISLEKEMKQPYIWLHSPASMLELVTVKAVFVTFVTIGLIIWCQLIIVGMFIFSDTPLAVSNLAIFLAMAGILVTIVANSIYSMAVLFFFWSIYRVLRTHVRTFGFVIAFGLYLLAAYFWEKLRVLGLFKALANMGPINLTNETFYYDPNDMFTLLVSDSVLNSVGSLVFYSSLTILLIWAGALLFEKKVRL